MNLFLKCSLGTSGSDSAPMSQSGPKIQGLCELLSGIQSALNLQIKPLDMVWIHPKRGEARREAAELPSHFFITLLALATGIFS